MIEVLVTLVIIAIGFLGVLNLQINAKRVGYDATQRTIASSLVQDMLERMRANTNSLASYATAGNGLGGTTITSEPSPDCSSSGNACGAAQLAAHDLWEWEQTIDGISETRTDSGGTNLNTGGIVSPTACIAHSAVSGTVTITVAWYGSMEMVNPTASSCGSGLGRYGTNDAHRQIFTLSTFIDDSI